MSYSGPSCPVCSAEMSWHENTMRWVCKPCLSCVTIQYTSNAELSTPDAGRIADAIEGSPWLAAHDAEVAAAERERCARIADAEGSNSYPGEDAGYMAERIAARIREGEQ